MATNIMREIPLGQIRPNPQQPRHQFDPEALAELAASIQVHGVIQPIEVEQDGDGYILHHGERRWRAAQMAGLSTIPAICAAPLSEAERLERALIENIQRQDMNPIDEALAYQQLLVWYPTAAQVAERVGRAAVTVQSRLRLLELPDDVQSLIANGLLPRDRRLAEAILGLPPVARSAFAAAVVRQGLNVPAALQAADKVRQRLNGAEKPSHRPYAERGPLNTEAPALTLVYGNGGEGKLPAEYQQGIEATCRACDWFDAPGRLKVCANCPLTKLAARLATILPVTP